MNFMNFMKPPLESTSKRISRGYTLIEVAIGVAILSVIVTVSVALVSEQIIKSKLTSATRTCQTMATAIVTSFSHTGQWPSAISLPRLKPINDDNSLQVLRSGANEGDNQLDPLIDNSSPELQLWKVASNKIGNINDHLLSDKIGYLESGLNWRGPYINAVDQDPFGRNYLIYIRATYKKEENGKLLYAWVISAGPNKMVETAPTDNKLKGDDAGAAIVSGLSTP